MQRYNPRTLDSSVTCLKCGREQGVTLGTCLVTAWPACCGQTMLLTQTPGEEAIDAAVREMRTVASGRSGIMV